MSLENISFSLSESESSESSKSSELPETIEKNIQKEDETIETIYETNLPDTHHSIDNDDDLLESNEDMDPEGEEDHMEIETDSCSVLEDPLDISWLKEHEVINNIDKMYCREPMKTIHAYFLYINKMNHLEKIMTESIELEEFTVQEGDRNKEEEGGDQTSDWKENVMGISKERIDYLTQSKRNAYGKYKLSNILTYCVTLEPEQLQTFALSDIESDKGLTDSGKPFSYFKEIPLFSEKIVIPSSIFIFHELNSVYFLFREAEIALKSILKNGTGNGGNGLKKYRKTNKSFFPQKSKKMTRKVVFAPILTEDFVLPS
jgi:hypothetical protein